MTEPTYSVCSYVRRDDGRGHHLPTNVATLAEFATLADARAYVASQCWRPSMFIRYPRAADDAAQHQTV